MDSYRHDKHELLYWLNTQSIFNTASRQSQEMDKHKWDTLHSKHTHTTESMAWRCSQKPWSRGKLQCICGTVTPPGAGGTEVRDDPDPSVPDAPQLPCKRHAGTDLSAALGVSAHPSTLYWCCLCAMFKDPMKWKSFLHCIETGRQNLSTLFLKSPCS